MLCQHSLQGKTIGISTFHTFATNSIPSGVPSAYYAKEEWAIRKIMSFRKGP